MKLWCAGLTWTALETVGIGSRPVHLMWVLSLAAIIHISSSPWETILQYMLHINIYLWEKHHVSKFHEIADDRNYYRTVWLSVLMLYHASVMYSNLNLLVPHLYNRIQITTYQEELSVTEKVRLYKSSHKLLPVTTVTPLSTACSGQVSCAQ